MLYQPGRDSDVNLVCRGLHSITGYLHTAPALLSDRQKLATHRGIFNLSNRAGSHGGREMVTAARIGSWVSNPLLGFVFSRHFSTAARAEVVPSPGTSKASTRNRPLNVHSIAVGIIL